MACLFEIMGKRGKNLSCSIKLSSSIWKTGHITHLTFIFINQWILIRIKFLIVKSWWNWTSWALGKFLLASFFHKLFNVCISRLRSQIRCWFSQQLIFWIFYFLHTNFSKLNINIFFRSHKGTICSNPKFILCQIYLTLYLYHTLVFLINSIGMYAIMWW